MRIGFDGSCLSNRRGFGRFARRILHALAEAAAGHELVVLVDAPSLPEVDLPSRCEVVAVPVAEAPSRAASSTGRRRMGDMLAMGRAASRARLDLLYFPATYSFFPVWNVGRVVVTMHDTLALAHPELVFPTRAGRLAWTLKEHVAARRAHAIMTVSESAARDLRAWFKLPHQRVSVMTEGPDPVFTPRPPGPDSDAALQRYGVDPNARFFLYVGGLSPHKNLPRMIEAFARSELGREGLKLVIVGDLGDVFHTHVPELRAAVDRFGAADHVSFTGFVPDADLAFLYSKAEALVQPSLMEGFGLPPVEAMACGRPVVSSTAGSLPEVVGDAGLFFDPLDVTAQAAALRLIHDDPGLRLNLSAKARARASRFTWEKAAALLLERFESLVPDRRARRGHTLQGPHMRSSATISTRGGGRPS